MSQLDYIECAGVRVPSDWSVKQLRKALEKRNIRFKDEGEIMRVFGDAIQLKQSLGNEINNLQTELAKWEEHVRRKQENAKCPKCGLDWTKIK